MSIQEFHAQLVSGNNKNVLFSALSKLRRIADPRAVFMDPTSDPWPAWYADSSFATPLAGQTV